MFCQLLPFPSKHVLPLSIVKCWHFRPLTRASSSRARFRSSWAACSVDRCLARVALALSSSCTWCCRSKFSWVRRAFRLLKSFTCFWRSSTWARRRPSCASAPSARDSADACNGTPKKRYFRTFILFTQIRSKCSLKSNNLQIPERDSQYLSIFLRSLI